MECLEDSVELAEEDFVVGKAQRSIKLMRRDADWHHAKESSAEFARISCGEKKPGDAGEYAMEQHREAAHHVRV